MTSVFAVGGLLVISFQSGITDCVKIIMKTLLSPHLGKTSGKRGIMVTERTAGRAETANPMHLL